MVSRHETERERQDGSLIAPRFGVLSFITDQCISSAVRDACDLGYLVTLASDACATYTQTRHDDAIESLAGYCRQMTVDEICEELIRPKV